MMIKPTVTDVNRKSFHQYSLRRTRPENVSHSVSCVITTASLALSSMHGSSINRTYRFRNIFTHQNAILTIMRGNDAAIKTGGTAPPP